MKTETKSENYQLKGNPVVRVPVIGNLVYDEIGKEVLALHNEKFNGISSIEDNHSYKQGQPISYSNLPRKLSYNQILREKFPFLNVHTLSDEETVMYWDLIPERDSTYADIDPVVFPKEGPNEDLRKRVLDILKKQRTEVPLVISGLGVEKADNNHGFTFIETPYTKAKEASYLSKDGKVVYDKDKGLVNSEQGIPIWTAKSGLRGLYRVRSGGLYARSDDLLNSDEAGRVQLVQDPQGSQKNLEDKLSLLREQAESQIAEINERYNMASEYIKTGKKF